MLGNLITKFLSIVYLIPLLRFNEEIGNLNSFLLVPFALIVVFGTLGLDVILTSEIVKTLGDKNKLKSIVISSFVILLLTGLIAGLVTFFGAEYLVTKFTVSGYVYIDELIKGTQLLSFAVFLFAVTAFFRAIITAMGEYTVVSMSYISEQVIKIILLVVLCYQYIFIQGLNVGVYVYILSISMVISMITTFLIYLFIFLKHKYYVPLFEGKYTHDWKLYKYLFVASLVFFAAGLFTPFFDQIDISMMQTNLYDAGVKDNVITTVINEYFVYSLKFIMIPITTAAAFITVMIRHLHVNKEGEKRVQEFNQIINVSLIYGVLSMAGLFIVGPILIELFYGVKSIGLMAIQSLLIPFYIIRNIIGSYIVTNDGSSKSIIISMILIIVSKYLFNIVLFPIIGVYGFIVSSMLAIIISLLVLILMNKNLFVLDKEQIIEKTSIIIRGIFCLVLGSVIMKFGFMIFDSSMLDLIVGIVLELLIIIIVFKKYIIKYMKR